MPLFVVAVLVAVFSVFLPHTSPVLAQGTAADITARYHDVAARIVSTATADSAAWQRMALWTDTFGPRPAGSVALEQAIDWALRELKTQGFENVHSEPAMVPHWVRGEESATLIAPRRLPLHMLGLGGSVGTPSAGITALVLVVSSFDELTRRAAEAKGKIVLFDAPFVSYGKTVAYRYGAAVAGAKVGAVAALIRSVASGSMQSPHTGLMQYGTGADSTVPKIPTAALSVEDAMLLHRMADRGDSMVVTLHMNAQRLPDVQSRNVIAELRGSERPDEVVVVSGHIDSWDVGQGAMDDAGGFMAAWEAVRVLKRLGLKPRRTIRLIGWTSEENGLQGAYAYRAQHEQEMPKFVFGIESDNGAFNPTGIDFSGDSSSYPLLHAISAFLEPIHASAVLPGGAPSDLEVLGDRGVPTMEPEVQGNRYFWYHHSPADTPDKLDPAEVARCAAVMAVYSYVVADMPGRLAGPKPK